VGQKLELPNFEALVRTQKNKHFNVLNSHLQKPGLFLTYREKKERKGEMKVTRWRKVDE